MTEQTSKADEGRAHAAVMDEATARAVIAPLLPDNLALDQLSPIVLAYIGDAVFEVYVRQRLVSDHVRKPHALHRAATRHVSAAAQARLLKRWMPLLTVEEAEVVRRGRNAKSGQPPRNADPGDYRHATALECLVGHLYFHGRRARLEQLMDAAFFNETDDPNMPTKEVE